MDGGSFTGDSHSQAAKSTDRLTQKETTSTTVGRTRHPSMDMTAGLYSLQTMHLTDSYTLQVDTRTATF